MEKNTDVVAVGEVIFGGRSLNIYQSVDEPLFLGTEVAQLIDYSNGNVHQMLDLVEEDEKIRISGRYKARNGKLNYQHKWFVTELGLYNVLSQSRKPLARGWRRIVHEELIELRKTKGLNIKEQFDIWDEKYSDLYFDQDTGIVMQSVTTRDGDVEQIPYEYIDGIGLGKVF